MQKTLIIMAVRKEIVRNMKGMRKRIGHFIRYGKKQCTARTLGKDTV